MKTVKKSSQKFTNAEKSKQPKQKPLQKEQWKEKKELPKIVPNPEKDREKMPSKAQKNLCSSSYKGNSQ